MEHSIHRNYQQLIQQTTDEGMLMCWSDLELRKARDGLKRAEGEEVRVLRGLCGL